MPTVDVGALGRRVARAREARGWDQSELARRAGLSPSYVSRLESAGFKRPSLSTLRAIAAALGCRLADLAEPPPDPLAVDLMDQVRELAGSDERMFREMLAELLRLPPEERPGALEFARAGLKALADVSNGARR